MLKKTPLLLSSIDNKLTYHHITEINNQILISENFEKSFLLKEKDLSLFHLILKLTDNNTLAIIDFIVKSTNKKYKSKEISRKEEIRNFLIKQIFLLFKYLSLHQETTNTKYVDLYQNLYKLIFKFQNSFKLTTISDIIEIIRYNIIISLNDLINKNYIFNCSLNYLVDFYKTIINQKKKDENEIKILFQSLIKLFETIYRNILKNKSNLRFLQRYENVENLALFRIIIFFNNLENEFDGLGNNDILVKLNDIIKKIILLVFSFNCNKLINEIILTDIKEGFFELKNGNDIKIKNVINLLTSKIDLINNIYLNEKELLKNDIYFPKKYFVFNSSPNSGIDYNPKFELFNYNFILMFSFKLSDNTKNYPLISFISGENGKNEGEILLNISLQNKKLTVYFQNEYQESSNIEIQNEKTYFVIIEYFKGEYGYEKLKMIINNSADRKFIELGLISYDKKILMQLGYITQKLKKQNAALQNLMLNYDGIMGPVIIYPDKRNKFKDTIFKNENEEIVFVNNINKLYGFYDNIIYKNKEYNLKDLYLYENFRLISSKNFMKANSYIHEKSNELGKFEFEYFIISPLSIINSYDSYTRIFMDNINGHKRIEKNKDVVTFFNTLIIPSRYSEATYAKMNINAIQSFVENDGIHLLTLILEYYYNLLKMVINYSQYDNKLSFAYDINNALVPIFDLITNIIMFFQIDLFSNDLDTFGFSLLKVMNLLGDIKPLNAKLIKSMTNNIDLLTNFYNENIGNTKISQTVRNFINKIFDLICFPKFYDLDNYEQMKNIFRLFHEILINNYELMNNNTFVSILQFSFVLDIEIDEDDDEKEFKLMKGEYKSLIELIIKQNESLPFYLEFLKNVFQRNLSIKIKYKLIKIYYKCNEAISFLSNVMKEEKEEKKEDKKENKKDNKKDNKDKSFWNIFRNRKDSDKNRNSIRDGNLIAKYDYFFTKVLAMRYQNNPINDKYHELLKAILIQLIFEQALFASKKNPEDKYFFFSEEQLFKKKEDIKNGENSIRPSIHQKSKSIKEMTKLRKSSHIPEGFKNTFSSIYIEGNKKNPEANQFLFDKILETNKISFYVIKSLFCCLFDKWDRNDKFNFFKNNTDIKFDPFESNFGNFTRYKKELMSEFFELLMLINNKEDMEKSLKLVFAFLEKCIYDYKSIDKNRNMPLYNVKYYKKRFFHIFESKVLMNKFFEFCLINNKYIPDKLREFLIINVINICNSIIEYHPRPFIFSFLKKCIKNKDTHKNIYPLLKGIFEFIIINIQKDSQTIEKSESNSEDPNFKYDSLEEKDDDINSFDINSFLYFNEIRLIKKLIRIFNSYQIEVQKLLIENNFQLLNCLQSLIIAFCSSKFVYDLKIYIFHPTSLLQDKMSEKILTTYNNSNTNSLSYSSMSSKEDEKARDKIEIKLLQSCDSKVLTNQILILNIMELIFLTNFILWTIPFEKDDTASQKILHYFMKPIFEYIFIDDHFLTYYLDIFNQKNFLKIAEKEEIPNILINKYLEELPIKYHHWLLKNASTKDNRLFSALLFLIILKYESLIILFEKNKGDENSNRIEMVRKIFSNNVSISQNDLFSVIQIIEKIKDNKKIEIIFEKEELINKEFKNFNKNYYKFLLNYVNKLKNNITNENVEIIKNELEKKFIKEEEEKKRMKINWINGSYSRNNSNSINDENSTANNTISLDSMEELKNIETFNQFQPINKTPQKKVVLGAGRKDSFNKYYKDEDGTIVANRKLTCEYNSNNLNNNNNNFHYICQNVSFLDAEDPVLCTKRDLIIKKFGFFFFDEYFKDERFIKMKNYFMYLYPSSNPNNNYNGFEKQMKINYPSTLKNFSNCINYYPRLFIRPEPAFFANPNLHKSHEYLKLKTDCKKNKKVEKIINYSEIFKHIINEEENKIMHLEYGHGLLNQNNFNLFSAGNTKESVGLVIAIYECEYINNRNTFQGNIKLINNYIIFQTNMSFDFSQYDTNSKYVISTKKEEINQKEKQIIINVSSIKQVIARNFLFYNQAVEIFLYNGKSYFFNLYEPSFCSDFIYKIKCQFEYFNNEKEIFEVIENPIDYFNKKKYCNNWLDGKITTLDYLLLINKFSGRSYNDLTQYIIFPWLLNNYSDIKNKNNYRKMHLSMAIQDQDNLEMIKQNYERDKDLVKRSHFQYHYSNSSYINLYLLRLNPFTYNQIKQNGHFDSPDRQIESMQDMCHIFKDFKETSELIPEYFFMVECFINLNFNFFGNKNSEGGKESIVNNIKLTNNFSSLLEMLLFHQSFINSNEISNNINKWIDNIFGENQITNKKNVINSYPVDCYEKYVKEEVDPKINVLNEYLLNDSSEEIMPKIKKLIKEIKSKTDYAYLFGQCPKQIFQKTHPIFSLLKKMKKASTNYDENNLKNDTKIFIMGKRLLYLDYKNGNNNFYVLTLNQILVYNKFMKIIQMFDINIVNQPYSINIEDNNLFLRFLYKNLIFEIEDCKIIFIGGYIDNTYKIYYKEKDKDNIEKETMMISVTTESQVTCMKNMIGKNIFFTGHKNGKIIKWKYELSKNNKKDEISQNISSFIKVNKISSIIGHKKLVQIIDINDTLKIFMSSSNDGFIFIRKLYDYELLNIIKYNPLKRSLIDICFDKQVIIATFFNNNENKEKKVKIAAYSLNGIKLSDIEQNISLPIILNQQTDEIIAFINGSLYKLKITFNEYTDLLLKLIEKTNLEENKDNPAKNFINEINKNVPVSLCYDYSLNNLYCLLQSGLLFRINIKK